MYIGRLIEPHDLLKLLKCGSLEIYCVKIRSKMLFKFIVTNSPYLGGAVSTFSAKWLSDMDVVIFKSVTKYLYHPVQIWYNNITEQI